MHPYPAGIEEPRRDRKGSLPPAPKVKGRWYESFVEIHEPDQADAVEIAARIEAHLYRRECRLHPAAPPKRRGKIEARAESISRSVLRIRNAPGGLRSKAEWDDEDLRLYRAKGDPAQNIYHAAGWHRPIAASQ
jgi:hypothetical protein